MRVDANGYDSGKGRYISLFIHIMKGENDHQLQWPFEHEVMYGVLNWKRDENHIIKLVPFKAAAATAKQRVTLQERAEVGWGYPQFLPHSLLPDGAIKNVQYLHHDCLCLQVLKVEPPM